MRIEEARTAKQKGGVPLNKQNRPNPTLMPKVNNGVIFGDSIVNFNRQSKYKINKGIQRMEGYDLNIFPVLLLKTFYTILTEP